jgi:hypothetical protein
MQLRVERNLPEHLQSHSPIESLENENISTETNSARIFA